jgi:anaerobic selenocysteine-containing dehydrogenase
MVATVREGKLITLEGDFDHIVNRGSLCVKGISMFATHASPNRLTTPRYRAPGSAHWEDISWDDAMGRMPKQRTARCGGRFESKQVLRSLEISDFLQAPFALHGITC